MVEGYMFDKPREWRERGVIYVSGLALGIGTVNHV
jgi:hypothetical protein